jgi:predicted hydrocarbon binding protein
MISISDLLVDSYLPGNYFATDVYVKGDLELGLLENRRGDRLLSLPATLIQGMYSGLEQETGLASKMVLFNCGRWWGKNLYARFCEELTEYYQIAVADMSMIEFMQCLQQCWTTHGLGKIDFDQTYQSRGFLIIQVWNSPFACQAPQSNQPKCFLEAGAFSAFFSQLTGRELGCIQITCESLGADRNRFVLGLPKRIQPAEVMVETGVDHDSILQKLCN